VKKLHTEWLEGLDDDARKALEASGKSADQIMKVVDLLGVKLDEIKPATRSTFSVKLEGYIAQLKEAILLMAKTMSELEPTTKRQISDAQGVIENVKKVLSLFSVSFKEVSEFGAAKFKTNLSLYIGGLKEAVAQIVPWLSDLAEEYSKVENEVETDMLAKAAGAADSIKKMMELFSLQDIFKDLMKQGGGYWDEPLKKIVRVFMQSLKAVIGVIVGPDGLPSIQKDYEDAIAGIMDFTDLIVSLLTAMQNASKATEGLIETGFDVGAIWAVFSQFEQVLGYAGGLYDAWQTYAPVGGKPAETAEPAPPEPEPVEVGGTIRLHITRERGDDLVTEIELANTINELLASLEV